MDFKTGELIETKSRMGLEDGETSDKGYKLPVIRRLNSRDLMCSMATTVRSTVLYV